MTRKIIISGHSSGLGAASSEYYLRRGEPVLGIARRRCDNRPSELLQQQVLDLRDSRAVAAWCASGALAAFIEGASALVLINNAATVQPSALADSPNADSIIDAVALNVTAPLLLSNAVLALRGGVDLKIVHISSGAGRKAYAGWSVYGASKAALDHHARCVAAENHAGVRIASIAPGVIDTPMQAEIRAAAPEQFPLQQRFCELKAAGGLASAEHTAAALAALIEQPSFGGETVCDVRDYLQAV